MIERKRGKNRLASNDGNPLPSNIYKYVYNAYMINYIEPILTYKMGLYTVFFVLFMLFLIYFFIIIIILQCIILNMRESKWIRYAFFPMFDQIIIASILFVLLDCDRDSDTFSWWENTIFLLYLNQNEVKNSIYKWMRCPKWPMFIILVVHLLFWTTSST